MECAISLEGNVEKNEDIDVENDKIGGGFFEVKQYPSPNMYTSVTSPRQLPKKRILLALDSQKTKIFVSLWEITNLDLRKEIMKLNQYCQNLIVQKQIDM